MPDFEDRHPGVQNLMRWLTPNPNLPIRQLKVAESTFRLANHLLSELEDGPELTEGLRKLLEAKDCFVRASLS